VRNMPKSGSVEVLVTRRQCVSLAAMSPAIFLFGSGMAEASDGDRQRFIGEAFRMRDVAVASGDQAYGAVLVIDRTIAGWGPSRVIADNDPNAHAERVALNAAIRSRGQKGVAGAVIYSSSRPCQYCQKALAAAGVSRMIFGESAVDGGVPQP
jgi:tRNA(Arg) A34 adenosine deaminase TadA